MIYFSIKDIGIGGLRRRLPMGFSACGILKVSTLEKVFDWEPLIFPISLSISSVDITFDIKNKAVEKHEIREASFFTNFWGYPL